MPGDHAPTAPALAAYAAACRDLTGLQTQWTGATDRGLTAFNAILTRHGRKPVASVAAAPLTCQAESRPVQYTSPSGAAYRSLPDTEAIIKARAALAAEPRNTRGFDRLALDVP